MITSGIHYDGRKDHLKEIDKEYKKELQKIKDLKEFIPKSEMVKLLKEKFHCKKIVEASAENLY